MPDDSQMFYRRTSLLWRYDYHNVAKGGIKVDARKNATGRLTSKVKSVEQKLGRPLKSTENDS